jgi:uncharacterized protein (DUF1330 family)
VAIHPTSEQITRLVQDHSAEPVVMLNLLRFEPDGGREAYDRYSEGVRPCLEKVGATVLWYGSADSTVIGDDDADQWDAVILVRYPSRQAFLDMVGASAYQEIGDRRTEALIDSRLIACTEVFAPRT